MESKEGRINKRIEIQEETYFRVINLVKLIFWMISLIGIVSVFALQYMLPTSNNFLDKNQIRKIEKMELLAEDFTQMRTVNVPSYQKWPVGKEMVLQTTVPQEIMEDENLYLCSNHQDVEVWIDGVLRGEYKKNTTWLSGKGTTPGYFSIPLNSQDAGKTLQIHLLSEVYFSSGSIENIMIGQDGGFLNFMFKKHNSIILTASIMISVGGVFIFFSIILNLIYGKKQGMHYLGAFPLLIGIAIVCGSSFRQFYLRNITVASNMSYIALQIVPIPLLCFLDELQQYRYKQSYVVLKLCFLCNCIVSCILHFCRIVDFCDSMASLQIFIAIAMIVVFYCYFRDLLKEKREEVVESFVALGVFFIFTIMEILRLDHIRNYDWGKYISIGVFLFLMIVSFTTMNQMQRREKETHRAIEENEAKTIFLANISHEIRTPLNVILGMDEMILRESNTEQLTAYAESIKKSGKDLLYLINDILDFTKMESGKMQVVKGRIELRSFLDYICSLRRSKNKKEKVDFLVEINPYLPLRIISDEQHLRQIVTNFLSNAMKYTESGYIKLIVDYREMEQSDQIELIIAVKDTGIGIHKEDYEKLFEVFSRVDLKKNQNIEGTGLGLAISKQLSDLLGGRIEVDSEYGIGSTFTLRVPVDRGSNEVIGYYEQSSYSQKSIKSERCFIAPEACVLVIDDNAMNLDVIRELLKRTGMEIDTASDGEEGIRKMQDRKYHVILLDQMMPGMDGIETLFKAKSMKENLNLETPVIAVTANALAGTKEILLKNGFTDFISKPIDHFQLEQTIQKYLPKELIFDSDGKNGEIRLSEERIEQLEKILRTYDIHLSEGMKYTGDNIEQYAKFLEIFYKNYDKMKQDLICHSGKEDVTYFTTKIHALKGNAKSIGALDLFYTAQRMENRGKKEDYEYLVESSYLLYLVMERAKNGAKRFLDETGLWEVEENHEDAGKMSDLDIQEFLDQIREYIDEFCALEAVKLIKRVRHQVQQKDLFQILGLMEELLEDMQYDEAAKLLSKYQGIKADMD